jgi:hypothetical protein
MDLNITQFFRDAAPMDYSASRAEIGNDAGPSTWRAAVDDSESFMLLDDDAKRDAFRDHVRGFGAWSEEELAAWSDRELNALLLQMIAGDMREPVGFELGADTTEEEWQDYERQCEAGQCSSRISRAEDGDVYYYIGN